MLKTSILRTVTGAGAQLVKQRLFRHVLAGAVLSTCLTAALELVFSGAARGDAEARAREDVNPARAALQQSIGQDVTLLRGLAGYVRSNPELSHRDFTLIAQDILEGASPSVRHVALARDLVISHIYPRSGNEQAIGLDYRSTPDQWAAVQRVIENGNIVLAGPVQLAQGGVGLIARLAIRPRIPSSQTPESPHGPVWGIASIVVDFQSLLRRSGLERLRSGYRLALAGRDADMTDNEVFWGDATIADADPVHLKVVLPGGAWTVLIAPRRGWPWLTPYFPYFLAAGLLFWIGYIAVAITRDRIAAERRRSQAELLEALRKAEEASAAKSSFMAVMSHELRTPLNAIIGFSALLETQPKDSQVWVRASEYAGDIRRSGEFLLSIINDILDLSRIESGGYELDIREFDLVEATHEVTTRLRMAFDEQKMILSIPPRDTQVPIVADRRAIQQILSNLLSNALKYAGPGARIDVDVSRDRNRVVLRVGDNGPGIPPDMIDAIMEPFVQLSSSYTRAVGGVGLGLTICQSLARALGASLQVSSKPSEGTLVELAIPTSVDPESGPPRPGPILPPPP